MCWHEWTKWEQKEETYVNARIKDKDGNPVRTRGRTQSRKCLKCGWVEEYDI